MGKVYMKCQAIAAVEPFDFSMEALKTEYDRQFVENGVDAYVDNVRQIQGTFSNHLIVDMSVAGESPLSSAVVSLIIFLIKAAAVAAVPLVVLAAAAAFVEKIRGPPGPEAEFFTPDGQVFDTLIEYTTYMQNVYNPTQGKPYTCLYCGQGFATEEERNAHQQECPWKDGPPYPPADDFPSWVPWVAGAVIVVSFVGFGIVVMPRILPKEM